MNKKFAAVIIIFLAANVYSSGQETSRAERVMRALHQAYPNRIEKVEYRRSDWALLMDNTWYYFAGGRILPEHRIDHADEYRSLPFYTYPANLPPWIRPTAEEAARYTTWTTNRRQNNGVRRSPYFLDALWQASNRAETESRMVRITFLGLRARVHRAIQGELALVETRIRAIALMNPEVQTWMESLNQLEGYGWRDIADTQARSYHSYGLAVDLLPRSMGRLQTYWLWTSQYRTDWWNVSYNERYHPPAAVITTFETYGFVWGGKWPLFDTMHFEYRPEILILNGFRQN
ncbi:MAG: M15 family metallopeptidase [Treponema sp.]|nr:M15 family metallopeptidase [Treponema sp.]MCL2237241.1 M15 family metallopeptidase [Treponema sp.]